MYRTNEHHKKLQAINIKSWSLAKREIFIYNTGMISRGIGSVWSVWMIDDGLL